jgi:hypothetical protein
MQITKSKLAELIEEVLNEYSATGGVAGFEAPLGLGKKKGKNMLRKILAQKYTKAKKIKRGKQLTHVATGGGVTGESLMPKSVSDVLSAKSETFKAVVLEGKQREFEQFFSAVANLNSLTDRVVVILENFNDKQAAIFVNGLYAHNTPRKLDKMIFVKDPWKQLWDLSENHIGKGEIALAALIKGATLAGHNKKYDLIAPRDTKNTQYEIKDYSASAQNTQIRTGTLSSVSQFEFWNKVIDTYRFLTEMVAKTDTEPSRLFGNTQNETLHKITERIDTILKYDGVLRGEFNKAQAEAYNDFYNLVSNITEDELQEGRLQYAVDNSNGDVDMLFESPLELSDTDKAILGLDHLNEESIEDNYIYQFKKLVQHKDQLLKDLNEAAKSAWSYDIDDTPVQFLVVRPDGIKFPTKFEYASISQGNIRIKEIN